MPRAWSTGIIGWCAAESGDAERGIRLLTEAITALHAVHSRNFMSYLLGLLAQAHMNVRHPADAMKAVEEGIALADTGGERFYSSELHRLQGELFAHPPHGQMRKAETSFRLAVEVARQQGAVTLERKSNASLRRWFA